MTTDVATAQRMTVDETIAELAKLLDHVQKRNAVLENFVRRSPKKPASWSELLEARKLVAVVLEIVVQMSNNNVRRSARIHDLELRAWRLENSPPTPTYKGIFTAGHSYTGGDLVTRRGGLWLALQEQTKSVPGADGDAWKLIVKSGSFDGAHDAA